MNGMNYGTGETTAQGKDEERPIYDIYIHGKLDRAA